MSTMKLLFMSWLLTRAHLSKMAPFILLH